MRSATGESLKSKLDGNQLDLSLSSLEVVPVKELVRNKLEKNTDFKLKLRTLKL